jgi:hypothetical protein
MNLAKLAGAAISALLAHALTAVLPAVVMAVIGLFLLAGLCLLTVRQLLFGRDAAPSQRLERLILACRRGSGGRPAGDQPKGRPGV